MPTTTAAGLEPRPAAADAPAGVLLGEQTAASLLHNVAGLYTRHFGVIFWSSLLPLVPLVAIEHLAEALAPEAVVLASLLTTFACLFISAALTVIVSDVCLGRRPHLSGAYARVLAHGRWLRLLGTILLLYLLSWLGLVLLVLPGLWFAVRASFSAAIVVLEERSGWAAIQRSMALTHGQFWRLAGLIALPVALAFMLGLVVPMLLGGVLGVAGIEDGWVMDVAQAVGTLVLLALLLPTVAVTVVLLYYDQRARRESYDAQALAEDLMR